jgi:hypothetical protein
VALSFANPEPASLTTTTSPLKIEAVRRPNDPTVFLLLLAMALLGQVAFSGCGGSNICLGCDPDTTPTPNPENSVAVDGDIFTVIPDTLLDELVVLACSERPPETAPLDCGGRSTQPTNDGEFSISKVSEGALEIFVYRRTDTSLIAELEDPTGVLGDVRAGETADIQSMTVNFNTGIATALHIDVGSTPTPTPAPTATAEG